MAAIAGSSAQNAPSTSGPPSRQAGNLRLPRSVENSAVSGLACVIISGRDHPFGLGHRAWRVRAQDIKHFPGQGRYRLSVSVVECELGFAGTEPALESRQRPAHHQRPRLLADREGFPPAQRPARPASLLGLAAILAIRSVGTHIAKYRPANSYDQLRRSGTMSIESLLTWPEPAHRQGQGP